MKCSLLVIAVACAGCVIVPVTKRTETFVGPTRAGADHAGPTGPMQLMVESSNATAVVTAVWPRTCWRDTVRTVEVALNKKAEVKTLPGKSAAIGVAATVLMFPLALVAAASGVITGATVMADGKGTVTHHEQTVGGSKFACPMPALQANVKLSLPSGATLDGMTDERGTIVFTIPSDEPDGSLVARAGDRSSPAVRYHATTSDGATQEGGAAIAAAVAPMPATKPADGLVIDMDEPRVTAATGFVDDDNDRPAPMAAPASPPRGKTGFNILRDAVMACGADYRISGQVRVTLELDRYSRFIELESDATKDFTTCVARSLVGVTFEARSGTVKIPFQLRRR